MQGGFEFDSPWQTRNLIGPNATPSTPEPVSDDQNRIVQDSLDRLHSIGRWIFILTILLAVAFILGFIGMLMLTFSSWFTTVAGYRIFLPTLLAALILPFILYAFHRNLVLGTYIFYQVIIVIWIIPMLIFVVWSLVDVFALCPGPDYCTNPSTGLLANGYIIYMTSIFLETAVYIASFFFFRSAKGYCVKLNNNFGTGLSTEYVKQMIFDALNGKSTRYLKGISMRYAD
jgi:hypothetical protein